MWKNNAKNFQNPYVLFQELRKIGGNMLSGNVTLRQALERIEPYDGNRLAWFSRLSRRVGIPPTRLKSLFYNPQCRLWSNELSSIYATLSELAFNPVNRQNAAIDAAARQAEHSRIKGEIRHEILQDIRAMLLELRGADAGMAVRSSGESLPRG
jgi:hypothetical protein